MDLPTSLVYVFCHNWEKMHFLLYSRVFFAIFLPNALGENIKRRTQHRKCVMDASIFLRVLLVDILDETRDVIHFDFFRYEFKATRRWVLKWTVIQKMNFAMPATLLCTMIPLCYFSRHVRINSIDDASCRDIQRVMSYVQHVRMSINQRVHRTIKAWVKIIT